ncbi:MAG: carboxypeptidase regulatory-like domain-containing protein, partial [Chloroflexi bacterium]|nr:carboxypeptidase regulatory-like domain-containing protein [Chloroflexota bacterium]
MSNEQYVAVPDALVQLDRDDECVAVVRTGPRGEVRANVPDGEYRATLTCRGFGSKSTTIRVPSDTPYMFRLLSDGLLGYMWPKWVRSGERSEFRVHSVEAFRLSLWRYGLEREFLRTLGWFDEHGPRAVMQITPDGDFTQTGVRFNSQGYGNPHHTQVIAGPPRSGLYYVHAETESGRWFSFPWVVAPARPTQSIAVLACTNTWNAYNNFGGRSNYINTDCLPQQPTVNARLDLRRFTDSTFSAWAVADEDIKPLSFERPELGNVVPRDAGPTDSIPGRLQSSMAPAEWRLLAWLERERFGYDYYADYQLHDGTLDLDAYRVLIAPAHPEYWSRQMFRRVKDWVFSEHGGRLMYLGGNGVNCEVEFLDSATMRANTTLRPAREGDLGMPDPRDPSIYYDSRFHYRSGESEASLLGVVTTDAGIMTAAPYRVIAADHWVFDGTALKVGDLFGTEGLQERCHGGASGH